MVFNILGSTVNPIKFAGINVRVLEPATYSRGIKVHGPAVEQMSLLIDTRI